MNAQPPGAAYIAWAQSMPALRCFGAAIRPWTNASAKSNVAITKTDRFGDTELKQPLGMTTIPAKGSQNYYAAARLPNHGAVIHAGSESEESSFTAVVANAAAPPHGLALLTASVSAGAGLGLGSTRSAVEHVLGHATVTTACGYGAVRYEPRVPEISEAEIWFIYLDGKVAAIARYEAV
jgi:hypothetical protein